MLVLLLIWPRSPLQSRQYISDFTRRRSRDPTRADIIEDIDSIRNGLFLNRIAQQLLGAELAFLRVRAARMIIDTSTFNRVCWRRQDTQLCHGYGRRRPHRTTDREEVHSPPLRGIVSAGSHSVPRVIGFFHDP